MLLHHIVMPEWWAKFEGLSHYESETLVQESFLHFSTPEQVEGTLNLFFKGVPQVILLHIEGDLLEAELKFESGGDERLFPHLYGKLNMNAVLHVETLIPEPDGNWKF